MNFLDLIAIPYYVFYFFGIYYVQYNACIIKSSKPLNDHISCYFMLEAFIKTILHTYNALKKCQSRINYNIILVGFKFKPLYKIFYIRYPFDKKVNNCSMLNPDNISS